MKSQQVRDEFIIPYLISNRNRLKSILDRINSGGWESWLQVELAMYILEGIQGSFSREQVYYRYSGSKYDMCLKPLRGADIYFEVKTQKTIRDNSTAKRLAEDIDKINKLDSVFRQKNVIIAFAITKLSNQAEYKRFVDMAKNPQYHSHLSAYNFAGERLMNLVSNQFTLIWYNF